jgi:hypothetical protein
MGKYRFCPWGGLTSLYKELVHSFILQRTERGQRPNPISCVSCVSSVVLMERETGSLQLLAPLLLTGGKGADLVICGNVVLNTLSACSTSMLLRDQICINSSLSRQVELSYATGFVPICRTRNHSMKSWVDLQFTVYRVYRLRARAHAVGRSRAPFDSRLVSVHAPRCRSR